MDLSVWLVQLLFPINIKSLEITNPNPKSLNVWSRPEAFVQQLRFHSIITHYYNHMLCCNCLPLCPQLNLRLKIQWLGTKCLKVKHIFFALIVEYRRYVHNSIFPKMKQGRLLCYWAETTHLHSYTLR